MTGAAFIDRRGFDFAAGARRPATLVEVEGTPPQLTEEDGAPTWIVRAANFVVTITDANPGTRLSRRGSPDEYMLFVPPGAAAQIAAGDERVIVEPDSLTIVPPGDSDILVRAGGYIYRIFSNRADDMTAASANAATYGNALEEVAPIVEWPEPVGGYWIRTYPLQDVVSGEAFGRIYRSTNLMVNIFEPYAEPRDQTALSPHSHADFEQGSLTMSGAFEHYLRVPWGKDRGAWRDDLVIRCGSPSLTVIPAEMIHTTAWFDRGGRMIDIFAPPRADFSQHPGWVRNEADYPMPEWAGAS